MTKKTNVAEVSALRTQESTGTEVLTPQTFNFMGMEVRAMKRGDDLWFVAKDVTDALEYRDANLAVRFLDDDERGTRIVCTPSGDQPMNVITEPGLYHLLNSSRKPKAKDFKRWVNHEVLPAINRTGSYTKPQQSITPVFEREPTKYENHQAFYLNQRMDKIESVIYHLKNDVKDAQKEIHELILDKYDMRASIERLETRLGKIEKSIEEPTIRIEGAKRSKQEQTIHFAVVV